MRTIPRQVRGLNITDVTEHILHCTWFAGAPVNPEIAAKCRNAVLYASGAKPAAPDGARFSLADRTRSKPMNGG